MLALPARRHTRARRVADRAGPARAARGGGMRPSRCTRPGVRLALARSRRPAPYRPHLPHPESAWAYAVARIRRVGAPANPPDGETVVEVLTLPPEDALAWLDEWEEKEHPRVLGLAIAMGLLTS